MKGVEIDPEAEWTFSYRWMRVGDKPYGPELYTLSYRDSIKREKYVPDLRLQVEALASRTSHVHNFDWYVGEIDESHWCIIATPRKTFNSLGEVSP
jgi:hypothetical protein